MVLCSQCEDNEVEGDNPLCRQCTSADINISDKCTQQATATVMEVKYVPCELLCYTIRYIDSSSPESLIEVIISAFSMKEIPAAKSMLWEIFKDHLEKAPRRSARKGQSLAELEADDIVRLGVLPLANRNLFAMSDIKFCAVNLDRIPKYNPEEINMHSIMAKMLDMQNQLNCVKKTVDHNSASIREFDQVISDNAKLSHRELPYRPRSTFATGPVQFSSNEKSDDESSNNLLFPGLPPRSARQKQSTSSTPFEPSHPELSITSYATAAAATAGASSLEVKEKPRSGVSEWQEVRKRRRQQLQEKAKDANVIIGKNNGSNLSGADPVKPIFVYNVDRNWSDKNIKDEMNENGVDPTSVRCISHSEAQSKSFKVFIKEQDYDKVMCEDFWASKIKCRDWIRI